MVKNAMEPQCFKWWEFPSIPGFWFSLRSYPDGSHGLLSMQKPKDMTQAQNTVTGDFEVLEWDMAFGGFHEPGEDDGHMLTREQAKIIYRHFGLRDEDRGRDEYMDLIAKLLEKRFNSVDSPRAYFSHRNMAGTWEWITPKGDWDATPFWEDADGICLTDPRFPGEEKQVCIPWTLTWNREKDAANYMTLIGPYLDVVRLTEGGGAT